MSRIIFNLTTSPLILSSRINFKRINTFFFFFYQSNTCHNNVDLRLICELLNRLTIGYDHSPERRQLIDETDDVMVGLGLG